MTIGDRNMVWANIFQSAGLWHFNIHRIGEQFAVFASRFRDGHAERQTAIDHATDLIKHYTPKEIVPNGC
jgi:hypothetical protein